jgi:hypothetical protein
MGVGETVMIQWVMIYLVWLMIRETVVIYWVVIYRVCLLGQDHWIIYRLGVVVMREDN